MKRLLHEPLVHFVLLGALLFVAYGYVRPAPATGPSSHRIELTVDELSQLALVFQSQFGRPPTRPELEHLVESRVQEEILYREALAMGLDRDDTIVRRRMAQKMQFLAEDAAAAREPTPAELRRWFSEHAEKFAMPGRLGFRHLFFSPDRRGERARDDARKALEALAGQPEDAAAATADPFMFADRYADRTPEEVGKEFGPPFAQAVDKLAPGAWRGPLESGYGWHLVYVDRRVPGRIPAFEEVESEVKTAWRGERQKLAWEKAYRDLRARYEVVLPAGPTASATP